MKVNGKIARLFWATGKPVFDWMAVNHQSSDVWFGLKVGPIRPKWDKSRTLALRAEVHWNLIFKKVANLSHLGQIGPTLDPNLATLHQSDVLVNRAQENLSLLSKVKSFKFEISKHTSGNHALEWSLCGSGDCALDEVISSTGSTDWCDELVRPTDSVFPLDQSAQVLEIDTFSVDVVEVEGSWHSVSVVRRGKHVPSLELLDVVFDEQRYLRGLRERDDWSVVRSNTVRENTWNKWAGK